MKSSGVYNSFSYLCTYNYFDFPVHMKNLFLTLVLSLFCMTMTRQDNTSALIPMPNKIINGNGAVFTVNARHSAITFDNKELKFAAEKLQDIFKRRMSENLNISPTGNGTIRLIIDNSLEHKEQYSLEINNKGITIKGASKGAVLYGVITLEQILMGDICMTSQKKIREIYIYDKPRFEYRAMMLDPARNYLPVESIKFFIDKMTLFKYNVLQLHLTDDQGWRIYIEKYPQLASKDHYTKEELKDIIKYAEMRNVTVIPEIDIPGHTCAMLSAFPEFKCEHKSATPIELGKSVDMMLCASVGKVYTVIDDIIKETSKIFPAPYIHLGGDEAAIKYNWAECPRCQKLMAELKYEDPSQLMIPFFSKVLKSVKEAGKKAILWCELDNIYMPANDYLFPYDPEVTLVSWRGGLTPKCLELTRKHGNPVIMAPGEYAYLDYPQYTGDFPEFNNWGMPITTLETCYQFDPGYGEPLSGQKHIKGIMATLWGEAIKDINRATYMAYPRGLALSEAGWTEMKNRNWESFKNRMYPNLMNLMKEGVSIRVPFEIEQKLENYR